MIKDLEREKASLKAKYKHKIIIKEEKIKASMMKEMVAYRDELGATKEILAQRESELETLYVRVEELEMQMSTNSLDVKEIHMRYKA